MKGLGVVLLLLVATAFADDELSGPRKYICLITSGPQGHSNVTGFVTFTQDNQQAEVRLQGTLQGFNSDATHAFHIHEFGDMSDVDNACNSAGAHFNPENKQHGAPEDENRHVGDLGNLQADAKGMINIDVTDRQLSLYPGKHHILGRACVVHTGVDDLGRANDEKSKKDGNAGGRIGCGVVGVARQ